MSKADKRRQRAVERAAKALTPLQWEHVRRSEFCVGAGYLVPRRLGLPADMVEVARPAMDRLTDPFGIAVREVTKQATVNYRQSPTKGENA